MKRFFALTDLVCVILLSAYALNLKRIWSSLPQTLPSHFNIRGVPDAYGSKWMLLFEMALGILLVLMLAVLEHFPRFYNLPVKVTEENRDHLYKIGGGMLAILKVLLANLFILIGYGSIKESLPLLPLIALLIGILIDVGGGIVLMVR